MDIYAFTSRLRFAGVAFRSPLVLFLVALLARLANLHIDQILSAPGPDHLAFGYEVGRIARSLVEGQGFSSPFVYVTGPTAWLGPVYPLLLAGCFKLFGVYSWASAAAILSINSLFAALTCVVVNRIGRETVGEMVGLIAAWFLAVAPFEINFATRYMWDTSLSALLLSYVFLLTLRMEHTARLRKWMAYGAVWGVIALANPSLLSVLPVAFLWLWHRCGRGAGWTRLGAAALVFAVTLVPWTVRNYRTLHSLVPLRDNLAMELYLGNHDGADGYVMVRDHLIWNPDEMAAYAQQGEISYLASKMGTFRAFVREHPVRFIQLTLKRILIFWGGIRQIGQGIPGRETPGRRVFYSLSSVLTIWGLVRVIRRRQRGASLFAGILLLYPIVYYVTHNHPRYRHPIEPLMALLGAYLLFTVAQAFSSWLGRQTAPASEGMAVTFTSNTGRSD